MSSNGGVECLPVIKPVAPVEETDAAAGSLPSSVQRRQKMYAAGPPKHAEETLIAYFQEGEWEKELDGSLAAVRVGALDRSEEATALYAKAEASMSKGLRKCENWLNTRDLFFEAGALFATSGYPNEAAKSFLHAAIMTRSFNNEEETNTALSLAAENLQVLQPELSVVVLNCITEPLAKEGLTIQAARCKRDAAMLLEHRLGDPDRAIEMYREAMDLYGSRPVIKSFTRECIERICVLTVGLGAYTKASELFMEEALFVPRGLPKTQQFLYSLLCMLAEGFGSDDRYFDALYFTRKRFDVLQEEESDFQQGKENKLMRGLLSANDHGSLNEFDVAVFDYKSCSSYKPDEVFDVLAAKCRENLYEHVEQFM